MSATALVVPSLAEAVPDSVSLHKVQTALTDAGVRLLTPVGISPDFSAYQADMSSFARERIDNYAEAQRTLIGEANVLVVPNDRTEEILLARHSNEPICEVPFSVGRLACRLIRIANEVYGEQSGRVFLSDNYPDGTQLFSVPSSGRSLAIARARLLSIYPLRPVALQGNYDRLIAMANTPRQRR